MYYTGDETTASLRASASIDQYTGDLGTASSLSTNASVQQRLNPRTTAGFQLSALSTRSAVRDFLRNPGSVTGIDPLVGAEGGQGPNQVPTPTSPLGAADLGPVTADFLEATVGRLTSYSLGGSVSRLLTSRDRVSLSTVSRWNKFAAASTPDYRTAALSLGYDRRVSERASVGADFGAGVADYHSGSGLPLGGRSTYLTPTVGLALKLSERVSARADVGVTMTTFDDHQGGSKSETGFAGAFELCNRQDQGALCATASRGAQPTANAGLTTVTAVTLRFSQRLGEGEQVSFASTYSHRVASLNPSFATADRAASVFAASGEYSRKFSRRFSGFINPGYARVSNVVNQSKNNFNVSLGLRVRLGDHD